MAINIFFQIYQFPLIQGWIENVAGPDGRRRVIDSTKTMMDLKWNTSRNVRD